MNLSKIPPLIILF